MCLLFVTIIAIVVVIVMLHTMSYTLIATLVIGVITDSIVYCLTAAKVIVFTIAVVVEEWAFCCMLLVIVINCNRNLKISKALHKS